MHLSFCNILGVGNTLILNDVSSVKLFAVD